VEDKATWRVLAEKGHPVSRDGRHGLLYNPQHLLGVEATASILLAGLLGRSSGAPAPRPVADMIAVATRDIAAGTTLTMDRRHQIADVEARMIAASPVTDDAPLPYYMAAGRRLRVPVPAGTAITRPMIEPVENSALWDLRAAQDERFFGGVA
jgi:predicted homoserine dehydrogenase-like protein